MHTKHPIRVLQFGEGNFLRAFVDWMFDITNEQGLTDHGIAVVQPLSTGMCARLQQQENRYHLLLRGFENGQTVESMRQIDTISLSLNPYQDFSGYLALAEIPELELIISNTTEAGIAYDPTVLLSDTPAASFPGKLTQFLYARFKAFSGAPDKTVTLLPCELIDRNGDNLKAVVERHAREWQLGDAFLDWLRQCHFLNSLVDRIVPGYPRNELEAIHAQFGVSDDLLVTAEPFHFWVIEGDTALAEKWPFHKAGLQVVWTTDMTPYRERKVRILNGCHTMTVAAAYLAGLDTVGDCMSTSYTRTFMERGLYQEIIPTLNLPAEELSSYANAVLERFSNPFIHHELLSITLNSFSKWKTRVLPSLVQYHQKFERVPACIAFSFAALLAFYQVEKQTDGSYVGKRAKSGGQTYSVKDDISVLADMAALWAACDGSDAALIVFVSAVLSRADWWGRDLTTLSGFASVVHADLSRILTSGLPAAFPV